MNSEELELSLRNEFESHLKESLAEMKQEVAQFQEKLEAEFAKHKAQLDEFFREFSERFTAEKSLDAGFTETVIEHLRLARDEGSRVAVAAMEKAEAMQAEAEPPAPKAGVKELRDAISDISTKTTQSSILKTLVHHAAEFTARGAFFIIKNEHLVGWRVFGKDGNSDEETVREVFFPVAAETILGASVRSLSAVEGSYGDYSDDSIYLNKLEFGHPDKMYAMPLVVRGRSVAVLYADNGENGEEVNVEALETLVRVASLTVEVLASARFAKSTAEEKHAEIEESGSLDSRYTDFAAPKVETEPQVQEAESQAESIEESTETAFVTTQPEKTEVEEVAEAESSYSFEPVAEEVQETETSAFETVEVSETEVETIEPVEETASYFEPAEETSETISQVSEVEQVTEYQVESDDYQVERGYKFESNQSFEPSSTNFEITPPKPESSPFETTQFEYTAPQKTEETFTTQNNFNSFESNSFKVETPVSQPVETVSESVVTTPPTRSRFSDRNVDLPIEVTEEDRRLHNDARRFARLLVSEIKLYNEQKVKEGREAGDLYERLREAIDRSREMYDKRVQPPVAARFDYFHYEVVNTLAEGDENKLGTSYPGAAV